MMIWEVSALNKLYHTNAFGQIRRRLLLEKMIYVIQPLENGKPSKITKFTSKIEEYKGKELLLQENIQSLLSTYSTQIQEIKEMFKGCGGAIERIQKGRKEDDYGLLSLYDCVGFVFTNLILSRLSVGAQTSDRMIKFYVSLAYVITELNPDELRNSGILEYIDNTLLYKSTLIDFQITICDLLLISAFKRQFVLIGNNSGVESEGYNDYRCIHRWMNWIHESLGVSFEKIMATIQKKEKETQARINQWKNSAKLVEAVKALNVDLVRDLLDKGENVSSFENGSNRESVLHMACERGCIPIAKLLISHGADTEYKDKDSCRPLVYCINSGSIEMTEFMIENKADIHATDDYQNRNVVYFSAAKGECEIMRLFISKGVDINLESIKGRTALSKACWNGKTDIVGILLRCGGININGKDEKGRTALHNAVWGCAGGRTGKKFSVTGGESPECARLLLQAGALIEIPDHLGATPLHTAASTYSPFSLQILIDYGAIIDLPNKWGVTALMKSCRRGNLLCAKILLNAGADITLLDNNSFSSIDHLLIYDQHKMLNKIINTFTMEKAIEILQFTLINPNAIKICIDNDSDSALEAIINYLGVNNMNNTQIQKNVWKLSLRRSLILDSIVCANKILNYYEELNFDIDEEMIELAVYTNDFFLFQKLYEIYQRINSTRYFLSERIMKAAICANNESIMTILISDRNKFANSTTMTHINPPNIEEEMGRIFDILIIKKKKSLSLRPLHDIYTEYNEYSCLHLALLYSKNIIKNLILETNIDVFAQSVTEQVTCLILAAREGMAQSVEDIIRAIRENNQKTELLKQDKTESKALKELNSIEFQNLLNLKDKNGLSALDYSIIKKRNDISMLLEFTNSKKDNILELSYKLNPNYDKTEIKVFQAKMEEKLIKLEGRNVVEDAFELEQFQYPNLNLFPLNMDYLNEIKAYELAKVEWIGTEKELKKLGKLLNQQKAFGVDIETHSFQSNISVSCLLQISTIEENFIVDTLKLREYIGIYLKESFQNPNIIKILHGCDFDIQWLMVDFGIFIDNFFDTARAFLFIQRANKEAVERLKDKSQTPIGALHLSRLDILIDTLLNVKISKYFQISDWRIRPVPECMLLYAGRDSFYLLPLYHVLSHLLNGVPIWLPQQAIVQLKYGNLSSIGEGRVEYKIWWKDQKFRSNHSVPIGGTIKEIEHFHEGTNILVNLALHSNHFVIKALVNCKFQRINLILEN